jgi:hypothetical protein
MYIAKKDFKAYMLGKVKKGQEVGFNKSWLDAGLIEEAESKPEEKKNLETKPKKQKKETK